MRSGKELGEKIDDSKNVSDKKFKVIHIFVILTFYLYLQAILESFSKREGRRQNSLDRYGQVQFTEDNKNQDDISIATKGDKHKAKPVLQRGRSRSFISLEETNKGKVLKIPFIFPFFHKIFLQ